MTEYHKINSVYQRDEKGRMLVGQFSCDEFDYLAECPWEWTEKVDGTNVRVGVSVDPDDVAVRYAGRTDAAQMPVFLIERLRAIFEGPGMGKRFFDALRGSEGPVNATLYGEGYGAKIQKGGGNYIPDGCDFVLFDIRIGDWWLKRDAVEEIAGKLGLRTVPVVGVWTLFEAIDRTRNDEYASAWSAVRPEGLVGRPLADLFNRKGERIITKVKHKDFAPGRFVEREMAWVSSTAERGE